MNSYRNQTKGVRLFNYFNKDVPVVWIWVVKDFLAICLVTYIFGMAEFYLLTIVLMLVFGLVVPLLRYRYGLEKIYQFIMPSFMSKYLKVFIPRGNEQLRD